MKIEEVVGSNVRSVREGREMTQAELAREVGEVLGREWTRQAISTAEKGGRSFAAAEVVAFAYVLETSVARLFRPDMAVREISVGSGGGVLTREQVVRASMHSFSADRSLDDLGESLRNMFQLHLTRQKMDHEQLEWVKLMLDQLEIAEQSEDLRKDGKLS